MRDAINSLKSGFDVNNANFQKTLSLTKDLINQSSISPDQSQSLDIIASRLEKLGFQNEWINSNQVRNLYSRYQSRSPYLLFVGHTDVVPAGDLKLWKFNPFEATIDGNTLYGRGAADMKSGIAAFLVAVENLIQNQTINRSIKGSIGFLITADEEAQAIDGTKIVVEKLLQRGEKIDYCLIGEPSSKKITGDTIKNGRRGSLNGSLIINGKQGHIAYPHLAENPIHHVDKVLSALLEAKWDGGNKYFQPTSLQFSNLSAGQGATNVIPQSCKLDFNFRYSPETNEKKLIATTEKIISQLNLNHQITWKASGKPFFSQPGKLCNSIIKAIQEIQGFKPKITTSGGTSDGRFIADLNPEIIELGLCNQTIHKINESIGLKELFDLYQIYYKTLVNLMVVK